ncbi:hypothetical protein KO465_03130 [Candidatus Micrarchaeota archaeon]|nr:hypothetical protein [Candidatus Micrarchaeota archaeon]
MWLLKKSQNKVSSRSQIAIKEVRDGILVLPNKEYRLVIETSSVNFELKSEEEQDVLIDNFQDFLNSLPGSLQILIRIREVDIDQYVAGVELQKESETKKEYQTEIDDYCSFIRGLVSGNKILSRKFYIILPYKSEGKKDFDIAKGQLRLTRDLVIKALEKLGMKAKQLQNLEILNLFYSFYNQDQLKTQELTGQALKALVEEKYV